MQAGGERGHVGLRPAPGREGPRGSWSATRSHWRSATRRKSSSDSSDGCDGMPATKTFHYNSIDSSGRKTKGTIEAANETAATHQLRQRGEVPLGLSIAGQGLSRELKIPGMGGRTKLKDLAIFARQFATMTASGMSLLRSLAILEEQTSALTLKKALERGPDRRRQRCLAVILDGQARPGLSPADDRHDPGRRGRRHDRPGSRADRGQPGEGQRAARQDQECADVPGDRARLHVRPDRGRADLHRPDLRADVQEPRRPPAGDHPVPGDRQPQHVVDRAVGAGL